VNYLGLDLLDFQANVHRISLCRNPFILLIFLMVLLASPLQLGCVGLTNAEGGANSTDAAQVVPSITTQPASQTVIVGQTATFSVTGSGTAPLSYQWRRNGTAISGATSASYITPPTTISDSGSQFTVTVSNSTGSVTSDAATLTVDSTPVTITVSPNNATVMVGSTQQFVGNVTGTSNTAVTWTVSGTGCTGAACGTISVNGLYVPPASVPSPPTVTVKATSVADPIKSASASVTIIAAVLLSISPASASVPTAGTQLFTASVTGTSNTAVTWTVSGAGCTDAPCGTIASSGLSAVYSAPPVAPTPASVNVIAISVADPTKSASASVTVVPVVVVAVSPTNASVFTGMTQQFNASVTGTSNTAVVWSIAGAGCSGSACGTVNTGGLYTAPAVVPSPVDVTVTATSVADPTKSGAVSLTIVASAKNSPALPTLPQATVDTTMPMQDGTVWNVASGSASDFQAKINASTCGDTIVLVAGSTYTGHFTFPNKLCSGWIVIRSSALGALPAQNHRVEPADASNMAKVTSNVTDSVPMMFDAGAHNWRIVGLEITSTPGLHEYGLVETFNGSAAQPSFVIVDRCYVHGAPNSAVRRALSFQGPSMAVVDSYISDIHDQYVAPGYGSDSQAVASWNSPGPILIRNNFLSAGSENIMIGGADPLFANQVPSDITIVGNHIWKDYANWLGAHMVIKNLLELKNARRVLVDGNVLEYSWGEAQAGTAIMITPRDQDGTAPWSTVEDLTITHNLIQHAGSGILTAGSDYDYPSLPTNRVLIQNNLWIDIATNYNGDGRIFQTFGATNTASSNGVVQLTSDNITIEHNTAIQVSSHITAVDYFAGGTIPNFQFTNNLSDFGTLGIYGDNSGSGTSLGQYTINLTYGAVLFMTSTGSSTSTYPSGTLWTTHNGAGFVDYSGGDYRLSSGSAYHNAGTDGKDIGLWDWAIFNNDITNALNGAYTY
jgi:hypothetical protein